MRNPSAEDLGALRDKPVEWIVRWLRIGLAEFLLEGKGREAFPGIENFVDQGQGSIASELSLVFHALGAKDRENFRDGVASLLVSLNFADPADVVVAIALVELGAGIGARGMLRTLADKSFTMNGEDGARLYDLAFDAAAQLGHLDPDQSLRCLKHLMTHPTLFQPEMVGRALVAMTRADRDGFSRHFQELRPLLDRQYGYVPSKPAEEQSRRRARERLVKQIVRLLPDKSVLAGAFEPDGGPRAEARNWWLDTVATSFPEVLEESRKQPPTPHATPVPTATSHSPSVNRAKTSVNSARLALARAWASLARPQGDVEENPYLNPASGVVNLGQRELAWALDDLGETSLARPSDAAEEDEENEHEYEYEYDAEGACA